MKWPIGKYNGKKIAGFRLKFSVNVFFWMWKIQFSTWIKAIHLGPFHLWIEAEYE